MATRPVKQSLPADLPENWTDSQYVSPGGTEVGLTPQHGYNYLNRQVNAAQKAAQEIDAAFEDLAPLDHETKKIPKSYFPDDLGNYQPKTESLPVSQNLDMNDTVPFYSTADHQSKSITIAKLKSALGILDPTISVTALTGTSLTCSDGTTTLTGTGSQEFSLPNIGTWTVTATYGAKTVSQVVKVMGALKYTVDLRIATKIEVTSNPTKTAYIVGEQFDPAGMVVKATFTDGSTAVITDQVDYSPKTMTSDTTFFVVSATIGGRVYTANVDVSLVNNTLDENSWAVIKSVSDSGTGATYWNVGDYKNIHISGTVQGTALNSTVRAFILGFNHNSAKEGSNRIHFQIGKNNTGLDIAFCDSNYDNIGSSQGFRMNLSNTNSGGWNGSYGRNTLLGNSGTPTSPPANSFMAALPEDLRAVMKPVTKYTDNTGNGDGTSGAVTATTDYLFFLSEFEVQGVRTFANQYEQNYQAKYDYYKAGYSKVKYHSDNNSTAANHWCRSAHHTNSDSFCGVAGDGTATVISASDSKGLAPGFCV